MSGNSGATPSREVVFDRHRTDPLVEGKSHAHRLVTNSSRFINALARRSSRQVPNGDVESNGCSPTGGSVRRLWDRIQNGSVARVKLFEQCLLPRMGLRPVARRNHASCSRVNRCAWRSIFGQHPGGFQILGIIQEHERLERRRSRLAPAVHTSRLVASNVEHIGRGQRPFPKRVEAPPIELLARVLDVLFPRSGFLQSPAG